MGEVRDLTTNVRRWTRQRTQTPPTWACANVWNGWTFIHGRRGKSHMAEGQCRHVLQWGHELAVGTRGIPHLQLNTGKLGNCSTCSKGRQWFTSPRVCQYPLGTVTVSPVGQTPGLQTPPRSIWHTRRRQISCYREGKYCLDTGVDVCTWLVVCQEFCVSVPTPEHTPMREARPDESEGSVC